jgi:hypothetical protein
MPAAAPIKMMITIPTTVNIVAVDAIALLPIRFFTWLIYSAGIVASDISYKP